MLVHVVNSSECNWGEAMWKSGFKWMFLIIGTTIGAGYDQEGSYGSFLAMEVD